MPQKKDNLPVNAEPAIQDGGSISYANEVIAIISGIAASEIEGVAGMVTAGGLGEIISKNRNITRGVKVEVGSEEVSVDLYTIVEYGQPIQKVASEVQENVRKSIESMTGLKVVRVDIHVQGVSFEKDKKENQVRLEAANVQHITSPETGKKPRKEASERLEKPSKKDKAEKPVAEDQLPEQEVVKPQEPIAVDAIPVEEVAQTPVSEVPANADPVAGAAAEAGKEVPQADKKEVKPAAKAPAKSKPTTTRRKTDKT